MKIFYLIRIQTQDWRRYRSQTDPYVPSIQQWDKETELSLLYCMHFTSSYSNVRSSKQMDVYKQLHGFMKGNGNYCKVPGLGDLGIAHSLL